MRSVLEYNGLRIPQALLSVGSVRILFTWEINVCPEFFQMTRSFKYRDRINSLKTNDMFEMKAPIEPEHLPLWVEYVRALGAPVVALVAAIIAGGIAYRQWSTARNKLKLDFFDKRIAIYRLAVGVLESGRSSDASNTDSIQKLQDSLYSTRWLFDKEVELYLYELALRSYERSKKRRRPTDYMEESDFAEALTEFEQRQAIYYQERRDLDKLLALFLTLEH